MTRKERWQLFYLWLFLGLVPLLMRPLWEPDEARYAEIPREMLALGDWLTPRLNYVLYFEKPPLQYWLSAAAMRLLGPAPFVARLPLALATAISLVCAWRLARRLGARQPMWAACMVATAILPFICGQILTLDALFSAFQVLAFVAGVEAVAARYQGRAGRGWTLLAFASLALAVLTKGLAAPVLVGLTLLGSLPFAWREARLRRALLATLGSPLGWLLFLLLAAPWFILVDRAHPGHANFFFVHEHFARFTSHVHDRQGSKNPILDKLYFVGVLGAGLLPWLSASWIGLRRGWAFVRRPLGPRVDQTPLHRWTLAATLLAFAWPLFFYSISGSKLPPYILPSVVPLLAMACALEREGEERRALVRSGWELLVLGGLLVLAGPFLVMAAAILALCGLAFGSLTIRDEGEYLAIRFGPLPVLCKRIRYADITGVETGRTKLIDGWGIHYMPGRGWTYNLWGYDCVKLTLGKSCQELYGDQLKLPPEPKSVPVYPPMLTSGITELVTVGAGFNPVMPRDAAVMACAWVV